MLIDTAEWGDAISTGREREADVGEGEDGLRVVYASGLVPSVTFTGPEGEVRLAGAAEIFFVAHRLKQAAWLACREAPNARQRKLRRADSTQNCAV